MPRKRTAPQEPVQESFKEPTLAETLAAMAVREKLAEEKRKQSQTAEEAYRAELREIKTLEDQVEGLRNRALIGVLTPPVIDALAPRHTRSCSDENQENASGDCPRCSLLEVQRTEWVDFKWKFEVEAQSY